MINPFRWEAQKRAAWIVSMLVGAALGVVVYYFYIGAGSPTYWLQHATADIMVAAITGAIIVGGTVYSWRLFRN